ncbi:MAG: hypothetical protein AUH89_00590 [Ktedonobacter sp. 13_1_40CM_4_52_4]|nr:MAG: hypothetical protein AUH89_00590 [Ktedonobacter sp. 13_1_40CM_4_52_4]
MNTQDLLDPKSWAERTFGSVQLHDLRRTRRAVKAATNLAENPLGSLPAQMHTWKETKALYRWLDEPDVTFAALMQPHLHQSREQATSAPVVLLVQDTTDIDLSHRRKISGVGQIGNERGRGFFVQTVLAVRPQTREVLGCMAQEPLVRIPAPEGEQRYQRRKREERESDVWMRQVQAIGTPESGSLWVHVGDRGADMFPFFQACQQTQTHFLVRAAQNRRVQESEDEITSSLTQARAFPSQASRVLELPARHGHQKRSAQLQLAFGQMTLLPPRQEPRAGKDPVTVWIVRVWEEQAPEGEEPLEWVLLTSVPTTTLEQAWERVDWYRHRWLVEIVQPQMTKAHILASGGGGDHIADLHLLFRHDDAIDEQFNELSFLLKGSLSQSLLYPLAKGLDGLHHSCQFLMALNVCLELTYLRSNRLQSLL